jgi:hypothetical protein
LDEISINQNPDTTNHVLLWKRKEENGGATGLRHDASTIGGQLSIPSLIVTFPQNPEEFVRRKNRRLTLNIYSKKNCKTFKREKKS